jgi:PleD family two-component response regulator
MHTIENEAFLVSFSIGAITFVKLPDSVEVALERADRLMYEVKLSGKNGLQHQLYD